MFGLFPFLFFFFFLATRKTRRKSRTYGAVYRVANDRLIGHQPTQKRPLTTMACEPAHLFPSTGYLFTLSLSLSLSCLSISLRDTVQLNQHSGSAFDGSRSLQCSVLFECVCVGVGMGVGVPRAGPLIIHQNWCLDYLRWRLSCHHHPNQFVVSLICNGMYSFFFGISFETPIKVFLVGFSVRSSFLATSRRFDPVSCIPPPPPKRSLIPFQNPTKTETINYIYYAC